MIEQLLDKLLSYFSGKKIKAKDQGIFDPYVPISSLKPLESGSLDWHEEHITASESPDLPARGSSYIFFRALIVVALGIIIYRLVVLQISEGQKNLTLAEGNRLRTELIAAPRGLIFDRNGNELVSNVPNFSVVIQPAQLPTVAADRSKVIANISSILGMSVGDINAKLSANKNSSEFALVTNINQAQELSLALKLNNLPGVYILTSPIRNYTATIPDLGHILGYVGQVSDSELASNPNLQRTSITGKAGIESQYDNLLQGTPGIETLEVNAVGQTVRSIGETPAVPGSSLYLGLDQSLQTVAVNALQDSISKNGATSGAAVVMDVNTGDVLAMASIPTYDNNAFSDPAKSSLVSQLLNNPGAPLLNRAIAGQYPSGSTIKPIYAVGALQDNVISANTQIDTSAGKITIGGTTFSDWTRHGVTNVELAIAQSNDIFFYTIGGGYGNIKGLGVSGLDNWLTKFGFGAPTGIDLPGEASGLVPTPAWFKRVKGSDWYVGNSYNLSIGQGDLLVTPLQLTRATAAIANGGKLLQPRVLKSVTDSSGQTIDQPVVVGNSQVASPASIQTVQAGMRMTVTDGSAKQYFNSLPFPVAAKTGTAQVSASLTDTQSWFTCYAPYNNPQIAISVIVENGGEGWSVAAPVAKNILEQYYHLPLTPITKAPPDH